MIDQVKVFCDCGNELEIVKTNDERNDIEVIVRPCGNCLNVVGQEKFSEGHDLGYNSGYENEVGE